ncbi:MAG TPA: hypothetical protein VHL11_12990 [Phototrophicaceae bacterium]|nr:hypothetical protein [Phototrophicaceae bacterium]
MPTRRDDWIDEDEYPDDRDLETFGDDSPGDYDPLTIGYTGGRQGIFWTPTRIILSVIAALVIAALLLPLLHR